MVVEPVLEALGPAGVHRDIDPREEGSGHPESPVTMEAQTRGK